MQNNLSFFEFWLKFYFIPLRGYLPFHSTVKQLQLVLSEQFSELLKIDYKKQFFLKISTKRAAKSDL